jgi:NAD(P)-dependent dehydrogenase (short-subunit alcohol dehydrogenase family)
MAGSELAIVTGASRGIGAAVATALAEDGFTVVLGARTLAECEALAARLVARGGRAHAVALDVTSEASVRALVAAATSLGDGRIDVLVNNAGIAESGPLLPRPGKPGQDHVRHLEVNLHGPRRMLEAAAAALLASPAPALVNVASSAALRGYAYVAAYCASKHALLGYTRSAALELGPKGLSVFALCPHYVDSPMLSASIERVVASTGQSHDAARAFFASQNPSGRLVTPQDVAALVVECARGRRASGVFELDGAQCLALEAWAAPARR